MVWIVPVMLCVAHPHKNVSSKVIVFAFGVLASLIQLAQIRIEPSSSSRCTLRNCVRLAV